MILRLAKTYQHQSTLSLGDNETTQFLIHLGVEAAAGALLVANGLVGGNKARQRIARIVHKEVDRDDENHRAQVLLVFTTIGGVRFRDRHGSAIKCHRQRKRTSSSRQLLAR
jgi:hypothetical protein